MWVITQYGYVSAVAHRTVKGSLMVRARDHESLEDLAKKLQLDDGAIYTDFPSDYPYRIVVTKKQFNSYLTQSVNEIGYTNFKSRLTKTRGQLWHTVAMKIWNATHDLTPADVRKKNYAAYVPYVPKGKHAKGKHRQGGQSRYTESSYDWGQWDQRYGSRSVLDDLNEGELVSIHDRDERARVSAFGPIEDEDDVLDHELDGDLLVRDINRMTDEEFVEWSKTYGF